jgi:hypothetical protein
MSVRNLVLPDDPELAFLELESIFRAECDAVEGTFNQPVRLKYYLDVTATVQELNLNILSGWTLIEVRNFAEDVSLNFRRDVDFERMKIEIRHSRRASGYSVRFDGVAKQKITHHLTQIRTIIDKLEIDEHKRERLIAKLSALQNEVDRNRTRFDALAALTIEVAGVLGDVVEKAEINTLLTRIAEVFWGYKEDQKALPSPEKLKQIEPPKTPTQQ